MWEITKMNDELKIILTKHMPDGIILIDQKNDEPNSEDLKLVNDEFLKILKVPEE